MFLKDDVLDAEPGRSRGFEGKATFRSIDMTKKGPFFDPHNVRKSRRAKMDPHSSRFQSQPLARCVCVTPMRVYIGIGQLKKVLG